MKFKKPELVKKVFTDKDFDELSWHDSNIFSLNFNEANNSFTLGLDYIFSHIDPEEHKEDNSFRSWIIPAYLKFFSVTELRITNLNWDNMALQFFIYDIYRELVNVEKKLECNFYKYIIEFSNPPNGEIVLPMSNEFEMYLIGEPFLYKDSEIYTSYRNRIILENSEYIQKIIYD